MPARTLTAPARSRAAPPGRADPGNAARARDSVRRRRLDVQELAATPTDYLVGSEDAGSTAHERERSHDGILRLDKRPGTHALHPLPGCMSTYLRVTSAVASLQADQPLRLQDRSRAPPQIASPRHAARSPLLVRDSDHRLLETLVQSHAQIRRPAHLALRLGVGRLFPLARRHLGHDRGRAWREGVAIEETAVDARAGVPVGRVPPGRGRAAVEPQSQISERSIGPCQSRLDGQNRRQRRRDIWLGRQRRQRRGQPDPRAKTLCMMRDPHSQIARIVSISHCTIV